MNNKLQFLIGCLLLALTYPRAYAVDNNVDNHTYIIGHWNYPANSVNPIYVISDGEDVELFINGISNGHGRQESKNLFTFDNIIFQPGTLTAVSYDTNGKEIGRYALNTSGVPAQLKLTVLDSSAVGHPLDPEETVIQCEITDFYGKRCFADNRQVLFEIEELTDRLNVPVQPRENDVHIKQLKLNNGANCISVKKPAKSGEIKITAKAKGLAPTHLTL